MAEPPVTTRSGVFGVSPATAATPTSTRGAVGEVLPKTSATLVTTVGPVGEVLIETTATPVTTVGPVGGVLLKTSATPVTTVGPVGTIIAFAPTVRVGLVGKVPGRPHTTLIGGPARLSTTSGIDPFVTGNYTLHTGDPTRFTSIRLVVVRCTAAVDITSPLTAGVKVLGLSVYSTQELIGLTQAGKHWIFPSGQGSFPLVPPGQDLVLEITGTPTGTSQTIAVDVFGHEL